MVQKKTQRYEREHGRRPSTREAVTGIPSTSSNDPEVMQEAVPLRSEPVRTQAGITRAIEPVTGSHTPDDQPRTRLGRAAKKVRSMFTPAKNKVAHTPEREAIPSRAHKAGTQKASRLTRRESDIPMDDLAQTYSPMQTSLKAPFRADGRDHQSDQEFARGVTDNRWNDEDRYTNRSGDPRIGTHGRTYEVAEERRSEE